jgi:hypothetical protein
LIAPFNGVAMTAALNTSQIRNDSFATSPIQMLSLGILILYFALNLDNLIESLLDSFLLILRKIIAIIFYCYLSMIV